MHVLDRFLGMALSNNVEREKLAKRSSNVPKEVCKGSGSCLCTEESELFNNFSFKKQIWSEIGMITIKNSLAALLNTFNL